MTARRCRVRSRDIERAQLLEILRPLKFELDAQKTKSAPKFLQKLAISSPEFLNLMKCGNNLAELSNFVKYLS